jgi:hypothetical protein
MKVAELAGVNIYSHKIQGKKKDDYMTMFFIDAFGNKDDIGQATFLTSDIQAAKDFVTYCNESKRGELKMSLIANCILWHIGLTVNSKDKENFTQLSINMTNMVERLKDLKLLDNPLSKLIMPL